MAGSTHMGKVLKVARHHADNHDMSDLSRLLDDVYRTTPARPEPAWSSDTALDEVFAHWVPGPPPGVPEQAVPASPKLEVRDEPTFVSLTVVPGWSLTDDDILPPKTARRRLTLRRRR
jgi:hypothetical protein